jgi:hypothetical protein
MSSSDSEKRSPTLAEDLIWGVKHIAREINRTPAQTYHLIATGALKGVHKIGHKTIVASRRELRRQFGAVGLLCGQPRDRAGAAGRRP